MTSLPRWKRDCVTVLAVTGRIRSAQADDVANSLM